MGICTCDEVVRIPAGIVGVDSFRRWYHSAAISRDIKVSYLNGDIFLEAPDTTGKGVRIPASVTDHDSFRRWARSVEIPDGVRVCYLDGDLWVDLSMEQLYWHNRVKTKFTIVVGGMAEAEGLGQYFSDGVMLSLPVVRYSTEPDGVFVSYDALRTGHMRRIEGKQRGFVELAGTPDMVLEVVSDGSVHKDTVELRRTYWRAGVPEYWLVDARGAELRFDLLRRGPRGYLRTRPLVGSWLRSTVFGRSFRLSQMTDRAGDPQYLLETHS